MSGLGLSPSYCSTPNHLSPALCLCVGFVNFAKIVANWILLCHYCDWWHTPSFTVVTCFCIIQNLNIYIYMIFRIDGCCHMVSRHVCACVVATPTNSHCFISRIYICRSRRLSNQQLLSVFNVNHVVTSPQWINSAGRSDGLCCLFYCLTMSIW